MKFFIISVISLISSVSGVDLKCSFKFYTDPQAQGYNCQVDGPIIVDRKNETIGKITGQHIRMKNNEAVERLYYSAKQRMRFIPTGYTKWFPKLTNLWIAICPIESISRTDFTEAKSLDILGIRNSKIDLIAQDVFWDLESLSELYLFNNKIKTIHEDSLSRLTHLKIVKLSNNLLGYLPRKLFENNANLQEISCTDNRLKIIESKIFSGLTKVTKIELQRNVCITKGYPIDYYYVTSLNQVIEENCDNPMTAVISELMKLRDEKEATISKLQTDIERKAESLSFKELEIDMAKSEKEKLEEQISGITSEKMELLIRQTELEKELEILSANHSEAKIEIEEVLNKTIDLEINFSDLSIKLEDSLRQIAQLTHENGNVSDENSILIEQKFDLETNLTETLEDKSLTETEFYELQSNYTKLMRDKEFLELKMREMDEDMHNITTHAEQQSEPVEQKISPHVYAYSTIGVVVLVLILMKIVNRMKKNREKIYSTNEAEIIYHSDAFHT